MAGFSLVELTVGLALAGIAGLAVMKLSENADIATRSIKTSDDISQLYQRINDTLKSPNNCEASLGGLTANGSVPILYQVINGVPSPALTFEAIPSDPGKVSIASMTISKVDSNGTNGSGAIANLRITFIKPTRGTNIGGKIINRDLSINANLCNKNFIQIPASDPISTLMSKCTGENNRLIVGPHTWGSIKWAVCQDCTNALTTNIINACQSQGSGGGVDIGSLSELTCANQGGVWNSTTSLCNTDDNSADASCTALGGIYDPNTKKCNSMTALIASMPACVISVDGCGGLYANHTGTFEMVENYLSPYTQYNVSCTGKYARRNLQRCLSWVCVNICAVNYSEYANYDRGTCTTINRTGAGCTTSDHARTNDCTGCDGGCFDWSYDACSNTTSTQQETLTRPITVNKCCK